MTIRNHVASITAVAALTVGAPRTTSSTDPIKSPRASSSVKSLPPLQQAAIVGELFRNAKSVEQWEHAEAVWQNLRPGLTKYETSLNCKDYGASYDKQIAVDLVGEVVKHFELMLDVGKLIFALAGGEKDEALESLKDATKELAKEKGKVGGKKLANEVARRVLSQ